MIRRFLAILAARNREFVRDRGSLGWNFILPLLLVTGLAFVFSGEGRPLFKIGVVAPAGLEQTVHPFLETRYVQFFQVDDEVAATRVKAVVVRIISPLRIAKDAAPGRCL